MSFEDQIKNFPNKKQATPDSRSNLVALKQEIVAHFSEEKIELTLDAVIAFLKKNNESECELFAKIIFPELRS